MKIYKFGGASVKDAESVRNMVSIIKKTEDNIVVIVSAMGKMTNAFEHLCKAYFNREDTSAIYEDIKNYHFGIIDELFGGHILHNSIFEEQMSLLDKILLTPPALSYDYEYDRIVSFGELFSSSIICEYAKHIGVDLIWMDIRGAIITDDNYRNANINIELSGALTKEIFNFREERKYISQGFIAGTETGQTTTLGREGSDYTAAILGNILAAEDVTIWKDVSGIMNGDPKEKEDVQVIPNMSYKEAIELAHFGAKVIHPKSIKPLENSNIPLYVKSFLKPSLQGTKIFHIENDIIYPPIFINKYNQLLLTLSPRDFSFIAEEKLSEIFLILAKFRLKMNLMQNSAISFTLCIDNNESVFERLILALKEKFVVRYNSNVTLTTVRHYNDELIYSLKLGKTIFVEQRSRTTIRIVSEYRLF